MFNSLLGPIVAPIVENAANSVDLCSVAVVGLVGVVLFSMFATSFLFPRKY